MSFSLEVKKELCKQKIEGATVQSLLSGMILSSGSLVLGSSGVTFTVSSENADYIEYFKSVLNKFYPTAEYKETVESGTLYAEEICSPYLAKRRFFDRGENMIDTGFAMSLGNADDTKALLDNLFAPELDGLKAVGTSGADGERYLLVTNQGECDREFSPDELGFEDVIDVVKNTKATNCVLKPADALLLKVK